MEEFEDNFIFGRKSSGLPSPFLICCLVESTFHFSSYTGIYMEGHFHDTVYRQTSPCTMASPTAIFLRVWRVSETKQSSQSSNTFIWDETIVEINLCPVRMNRREFWLICHQGGEEVPQSEQTSYCTEADILAEVFFRIMGPLQPKPQICQQKCRYGSINNPWHCVFPSWYHYTTGGWQHSPAPSSYPLGPGSHKALST